LRKLKIINYDKNVEVILTVVDIHGSRIGSHGCDLCRKSEMGMESEEE
jgi:hypothetical protein